MSSVEEAAAAQAGARRVPTVAERRADGKAARAEVPRCSHAAIAVAADRDPIALLKSQDGSRVEELVPVRYGRMLASPFAFFRGAATVMAHDLAAAPNTGLRAQLSGDAHLSNFGAYASPERDLLFDLNDFDETLPGPFEWDVKRLATSFEVAALYRGFSNTEREQAVIRVVRAYRRAMRQFAAMGDLGVWYAHLDAQSILDQLRRQRDHALAKTVKAGVAKAHSNDATRALGKLTHEVDGELRFVSQPPLIVPLAELSDDVGERSAIAARLRAIFRLYRRSLPAERRTLLERFSYVDLARKVVGIGSVGTHSWVVLLMGRDEHDPLLLQVKEAVPSVLELVVGASGYASHGQRVVEGQRLMQASSDIFIGWVRDEGGADDVPRDYYVRQLRDWKASVDVDRIPPDGLARYGEACGWTLARAHARSGDRIAIAAYLGGSGKFDRAVAEFAAAYAKLNERDYQALVDAVADGTIAAVEHV